MESLTVVFTGKEQLALACSSGATTTLPYGADSALAAVQALTEGRLADVVYDVTGHPAVFPAALGLARRFGTVLLLGDTGTPEPMGVVLDWSQLEQP